MADLLLSADGLGKKYARTLRHSLRYGMRDVVSETFRRRHGEVLREGEFWALRDVSFELRRGECLAVLGGNGAGKSTLLKVLSRILAPDLGTIYSGGRIEKMIELMAGMSPALTGRENVLLRTRLLGLSREDAKRRLEEVVDFAELNEFIDTPVMYYSSGMKTRLGFASTVVMAPDILLIDEVLAVGDLGFRMKCYERVDQMRRSAAVVLVTHGMNHVSRMATSALVLHKGRPVLYGTPQAGIAKYQDLIGGQTPARATVFNPDLIEFSLWQGDRQLPAELPTLKYGEAITIEATHHHDENVELSVLLHEGNGPTIIDWHSGRSGFSARAGQRFKLDLGKLELCPGFYQFVVVGFGQDGTQHFLSRPLRFKVEGIHFGTTRLQPTGVWCSIVQKPSRQEVSVS